MGDYKPTYGDAEKGAFNDVMNLTGSAFVAVGRPTGEFYVEVDPQYVDVALEIVCAGLTEAVMRLDAERERRRRES